MAFPQGSNPYGTLGPSPARVKKINAAKKARHPAGTQPDPPPGPAPGSYAALYAQASKIANQQVQAQMAAIAAQQAVAKKAADQAAALEAAKGGAYSLGLQKLGLGPAIQGLYQDAGNTQASLAQGFSGDMRTAADADAAAQRNMLAGTGQEGAVRNEGANMGNVNYATNGYFPATQLNQTGTAFAAQAALQPGFASEFGQMAEAARRKAWLTDELPTFAAERAKAQALRPGLTQDAMKAQSDLVNQQFDNYINYINSQKAAGGAGARVRTYVGPDGTTYAIDPSTGQYIPTGGVTQPPPKPTKGLTSKQTAIKKRNDTVAAETTRVNTWLQAGKTRMKTVKSINPATGATVYTKVPNPLKYGEAYKYVYGQLWLKLKRFGYKKSDIVAITNQILEAGGMVKPTGPVGAYQSTTPGDPGVPPGGVPHQ